MSILARLNSWLTQPDRIRKLGAFSIHFFKSKLSLSKDSRLNVQPQRHLVSRANYSSSESMRIVATSGRALRYNGGTKIYNLWVKLLREHGYGAYIATVDGQYDRWLVDHQPVISYAEVDGFKKQGIGVKVVTSWLDVPHFEHILGDGQFFYFDAELKWTLHFRKNLDRFLKRGQIAGIGTHSRYIQSWYMAEYGIKPELINEWSDTTIFHSCPQVRVPNRIGCMVDGSEDERVYQYLRRKCAESTEHAEILKIQGDEAVVAEMMRTVDIFVGLNQGKHPLWGEGCPRTQQEAIHSGCVLVAFDVLGNREYLYDGWTGVLVQPGDLDGLWSAVEYLLKHKEEKERLRVNGAALAGALFTERGKPALVNRFLRLEGITKEDLSAVFSRPFWLGSLEVPYLATMAASAQSTIVEIGCAYGGSTAVCLLNKQSSVRLYSIDPFVPDSQGGFCANERECRYAVHSALKKMRRPDLIKDWMLIADYSHRVVQKWSQQIDLLFIDGSHRYEDVKQDFEKWTRYLSPDGLVLIHDSCKDNIDHDPDNREFSRGWAGPTRLVEELGHSADFEIVGHCYSITALRRKVQ